MPYDGGLAFFFSFFPQKLITYNHQMFTASPTKRTLR